MSARRGHGEGTIYQRGDGRWHAQLDLGWQDGRRRRRNFYGATRRDVQEQLESARMDLKRGILATGRRQTVEQFLERWLQDVAQPSVRPKTFKSYSQLTGLHLIPGLGKMPLERLTPQHVQAFLNLKSNAGLSPRTVQHLRAVLRAALNQAPRWNLVGRNVAELVDPPRSRRYEPCFLEVDEAQRFLEAIAGDSLEALYKLQLTLGTRPSEALGLTWSMVDFAARQIRIHRQLQPTADSEELVDVKTRTAAGRRSLAMPELLIEALQSHRARQKVVAQDGLVFTTSTGKPLSERNVVRSFKAKLSAAGLPQSIRFYDPRHSCASFMVAQGVHPRQIMEVMGHSQISVTMNTYSHIMAQDRRAADAIDRALTVGRSRTAEQAAKIRGLL
jgi:integrase